MDKSALKQNGCREFSALGAFLNFIRQGEIAYGVPDVVRSPVLNDTVRSIQSAYEVQENHNNSRSNQTVLESDLPDGYAIPSLESDSSTSSINSGSTTSGSFTLPPSENQMFLCELLKRVTTSNESIASACFDKLSSSSTNDLNYRQNSSITSRKSYHDKSVSETAPDLYNFMKTGSFDDHEIAQIVHDLVFDKYEEPYNRLLNKLKKLHLTEEENRFRSVVDELESVFKKRNATGQNTWSNNDGSTPGSLETCSVDSERHENVTLGRNNQTKMFEGVKQVYSSTDSELEVEGKPIGIPQSGKLDTTFTKKTYSTSVNMEPVNEMTSDLNKNNSNHLKLSSEKEGVRNSLKDLQKYLSVPDVIQNSLPRPVYNVEIPVYAFNVDRQQNNSCTSNNTAAEGRHLRLLEKRKMYNKPVGLHDGTTTFDQIEEHAKNTPHRVASPLIRSATNQSHMSDTVEYNEYNFLRAALGDELLAEASSTEYIVPKTMSVSTDDISELLSSTSSVAQSRRRRCRNRKSTETISTFDKKSLSLCNTVLQRSISQHQKSSTISGSVASYETITNFSQSISTNHQDKKLIKNKIFVHETIIDQAERALEYGRRKSRGFIGSPAHLEAERTLLVSKIRRQALINTLYTIQDAPSDTQGTITIENLRCTLNTIRNNQPISDQYYVCILQHKTTVYCTKIAAPNRLGWMDFGGCFIFDNVTNTFNIKIQLHCIQLSQGSQNCFVLPLLRPASRLPMMKLIGETYIGIMNRKNEKFSLLYRDGERFREHKLTASIHTSIKWPETLRGFLTIGIEKQEQQPIWNRRWCVLEHGKLKYYNYPSDENYCKPVGVVDLDTVKCCDESNRKYLRQKTLTLLFDGGSEYKIYYLSPDSTEEFILWRKNVEWVLKIIKEWNMF